MNCRANSYANTFLLLLSFFFFFGKFFEHWAPPYYLSCHEQGYLFEFPSLVVILEHNFYFINTMPLLTADPMPPFMSLLLSLVLGIFPFPSFSHNSLLLPFSLPCRLSQNFTTHLLHSNSPSCRQRKMKVLPVVKGKRSPPTICLPRQLLKSLPTPNRTAPRRRKGITMWIVSVLPSSTHGTTLTSTSPWCLVTIHLHCQAMCGFPFTVATPRFLGPLWLPPFPILIFVKGLHFPCPFSSNSGRALL